MNDFPRIVTETIVDTFGPSELIEQRVEVRDGVFETWRLVSLPEVVKVIVRDSTGHTLLYREDRPDINIVDWQLPSAEIAAGNGTLQTAQRILNNLGFPEVECEISAVSHNSATIKSPIAFVTAIIGSPDPANAHLRSFSAEDLFLLLRSGGMADDRSARRLYDLLPLDLSKNWRWRFDIPQQPSSVDGQFSHLARVRSKREFGIFILMEIEDAKDSRSPGKYVVQRSDGVRIIAIDDKSRLLLTHEKRSEMGGWDWRLPGGKVKGGDAKGTAKKELADETGFSASRWSHIYSSADEPTTIYNLHYFVATDLVPGVQALHGAEEIEVAWFYPDEAFALLRAGQINEDRTARVLYELLDLTLKQAI